MFIDNDKKKKKKKEKEIERREKQYDSRENSSVVNVRACQYKH
jgi:hypothetical protein